MNEKKVIHFLKHNIITMFGVPSSVIFYNATYFSSLKNYDFALENGISLKNSSNYYPRGNGLSYSTNKNLIRIIKKIVYSKQRNRHDALVNSVWVDCVYTKPSLKTSPYFLMYGKQVIHPPKLYLSSLQIYQESRSKPCLVAKSRIDTLIKLEVERRKVKDKIYMH